MKTSNNRGSNESFDSKLFPPSIPNESIQVILIRLLKNEDDSPNYWQSKKIIDNIFHDDHTIEFEIGRKQFELCQ